MLPKKRPQPTPKSWGEQPTPKAEREYFESVDFSLNEREKEATQREKERTQMRTRINFGRRQRGRPPLPNRPQQQDEELQRERMAWLSELRLAYTTAILGKESRFHKQTISHAKDYLNHIMDQKFPWTEFVRMTLMPICRWHELREEDDRNEMERF